MKKAPLVTVFLHYGFVNVSHQSAVFLDCSKPANVSTWKYNDYSRVLLPGLL